jgi:signal transduction histidine kinase
MTAMDDPIDCLLVDDLEENLIALEALLQDEGLRLLKARSGEEALELLLTHDVALALLDVQMPGMNGFEVARFMHGSERTRHVPIIFLTAGSADQQRRFSGYEAGAVDFIQKPIEPDILRSKAAVFFDLYRQRRQISVQKDELEALARQLQVADRRKNEFLAVLGHELRNPVMAFGAGLRLLERRKDAETAHVVHEQMGRCVRQLTRLVEDLLDIARIDQGKISLRRDQVHLQDALNFAVEASRHHIDSGGHELSVDLPGEPLLLDADYARLVQIFSNLLSNAAKYTPAAGRIGLSAQIADNHIVVEVSDTGPGIPDHMQAKIFELFAQVGGKLASSDGLGIGLALVKQLTELHGGSVELKSSAPDRGSVFQVRLPLTVHSRDAERR